MKTDQIVLSYSHPDPLQAPLVNPSHRLRFGSSPEPHPTQSSSASYASQTASSHSASEARHIGSIILRLLVTLSLPTLQSYEVHSFGSASHNKTSNNGFRITRCSVLRCRICCSKEKKNQYSDSQSLAFVSPYLLYGCETDFSYRAFLSI